MGGLRKIRGGAKKRPPNKKMTDAAFVQPNAYQRAVTCFQQGDLRGAEEICRQLLQADPGRAEVYNLWGLIAVNANNWPAARELLMKAIHYDSSIAEYHSNLAAVYCRTRQYAEAAGRAREALRLAPENSTAHYNLGVALQELNDIGGALHHYEQAVHFNPQYANAWNNLGVLYQEQGLVPAAEKCFLNAIEQQPNLPEPYKNLGHLKISQGEDEEAKRYLAHALSLRPGYPCAIAGQALLLEQEKKYDEAYALLKPIVESEQLESDNTVSIYTRLSKYVGKTDEATALLKRMLEGRNVALNARAKLNFSLGLLLDREGCFDEAFHYYQQANSLKNIQCDPEKQRLMFRKQKEFFSGERWAALPRLADTGGEMIFVLGMPRSGTSLVEQILASHPRVTGMGELPFMRELVAKLDEKYPAFEGYPACLAALAKSEMAGLATEYLKKVCSNASSPEEKYTDKMPGNFFYIGLIALLFPKAKIIHCKRSPLDTCLSIYFQDFAGYHPYAYNLVRLGNYYRLYEDLVQHWQETLGIPMFEVEYEAIVERQEEVSRSLVRFCELDWDPTCLQFYDSSRTVHTASYQQVREPIYRHSVKRWRNYEKHLGPLFEGLGMGNGGA